MIWESLIRLGTKEMTGYEPYFNTKEAWGDLSRVQWWHIHHLWLIRTAMIKQGYDWPTVIHCCYEATGHASKSFHSRDGKSCATDFHFDTGDMVPLDLQRKILSKILDDLGLADKVGLGAYPFWNNPGFHIDSRGWCVRWTRNKSGEYIYE